MSAMDGAICSAPVYFGRLSLPSCSSVRLALRGSACWVEMTTVWSFFGSTEPSECWTYSMVTWVLPSGLNHQSEPSLRTSVSFLPRRVETK